MYKLLLSTFLVMLLCGCTSSRDNSDIASNSKSFNENTISTNRLSESTADINAKSDEYETIDGNEPQSKFYYNRLYESYVVSSVYSGSLSDFDYQILDGYKFIGVVSYKSEDEWEEIDSNFSTNFFAEGDAVLYNEEKDNFYFWHQSGGYWVEITEFPVIA